MPRKVNCPGCKRQLSLPDNLASPNVRCPMCQLVFSTAPLASREPVQEVSPAGFTITLDPPDAKPPNPFDFQAAAASIPPETRTADESSLAAGEILSASFAAGGLNQPRLAGDGKAVAATLFLLLGCGVQLILFFGELVTSGPDRAHQQVPEWRRSPQEFSATAGATSFALLGCGMLMITLATIISVLLWVAQAHVNLRLLQVKEREISPGAAVGWFFVPVANLFMPYLAMQQLWKASTPAGSVDDVLSWKANPNSGLVSCWWGAVILSSLLSLAALLIGLQVRQGATLDADKLMFIRIAHVGAAIAGLFSAFCLMGIIHEVQTRQKLRYERIYGGPDEAADDSE